MNSPKGKDLRKRALLKNQARPGLLTGLLFHLAYFCGVAILATLLSAMLGWGWAFIIMALLWVPMFWLFPALWKRLFKSEPDLHWLASLLVFLTVAGVCKYSPPLRDLLMQTSIPYIRASEIGNYPLVPAFRFSDAQVRTEYSHLRTTRVRDARRSTTTVTHVAVAPVTDASWTVDDPVTAWAACYGNEAMVKRCPHWGMRNASAIADSAFTHGSMSMQAVRDATSKFDLKTTGDARLLEWVPSVEGAISSNIAGYLASIFLTYALWAAMFSVGYWSGRKSRNV
jgi:hypothetical protein